MTDHASIPGGAVHELPGDLKDVLEADSAALATWQDITPLARNEWICWVTSAKQTKTRERRIAVGLDKLRKGMRRPCCWPPTATWRAWCRAAS